MRGITLFILWIEVLFAPLALSRRLRPWLWGGMLVVQFGFAFLLNFADLTLAMLLFHVFTFDPAWLPAPKAAAREQVYYDGHCGLCHRVVRFILAEDAQRHFRLGALQGSGFAAALDADTGRYAIKGVMGPDEFHDAYPWAERPGLDNNAYTNVMAAWVLAHGIRALEIVDPSRRRELCETLALADEELAHWDEVSRRLVVPFHGDGIISQFEHYDRLEEFDWEGYRSKYGDIRRLDRILEAEGDSVNRYKASKQADVLMLFYLFSAEELSELFARLGYDFDGGMIPKNVDYYLDRTSNGSTLSAIVHSWVLARSDRARSWGLLKEALESDIADVQGGTTPEGIHLGAMAGTVDLVQRGQTGLVIREDFIRLNPCLPEELQGLKLCIRYRGSWLELDISCERMLVAAPDGWTGPTRIRVRDSWYDFGPGRRLELGCRLEEGGWRPQVDEPST